jgi:hypothetical protein
MEQFSATVKRIAGEQVKVTMSDGLEVFWVFSLPYIHRSGSNDLFSLDEAEQAELITVER